MPDDGPARSRPEAEPAHADPAEAAPIRAQPHAAPTHVASAHAAPTKNDGRAHPGRTELGGAIGWTLLAAAVFVWTTDPERQVFDYFVRLADAFLHGRLGVTEAPSWLNELIPAGNGLWYVPYPPMPAIVLVPFVAILGTEIHQQLVSAILGAASVGLAWLALGRLDLPGRARVWLTATFGFGTVLWFVAKVGSAWYFAHVVAVLFMLAALILVLDRRAPFLAGLLLGCAAIARLPVGLTAPFFLAAALGLGWPPRLPEPTRPALRTGLGFVVGLGIPLAGYALYNVARWGTPIDQGYVRIPGIFEDPIYAEHGILSIAYIPRNLYAIFFRSWNYVDDPPFLQPSWWGLSVFLTTPVYLWLAKARWSEPRVAWAAIGTALALVPILTHGNVGITQFGYRFSLDVQPLLFVILASAFRDGMARLAQLACLGALATCAYAIWAIGIGFVAF
jgi:hypothetical protein